MYWGCHSEPLTTSLEPSLVCHYFHLVVTESIWCALGNKKGIIYTKGKVTQNWKFVIIYSPSRNLFWVQEAAAIVKGIVETLINVVWQEVPLNAILHQRMAPEPDFRNWVLWRPSRDRLSPKTDSCAFISSSTEAEMWRRHLLIVRKADEKYMFWKKDPTPTD